VPPLANVGILLGSNRPDLAAGSLLLFVTNYLAILLTGSFVFGIMGYPSAALEGKTPRIKHAAIAIVVVMVMIVAVPLGVTSFRVMTGHAAESGVAEQTKAWLEGSDYRFVSATTDHDSVNVIVAGQGRLPAQEALVSSLKGKTYGRAVNVQAVPSIAIEIEPQ
jgi:uncharacterized membrane protein